MKVAVVAVGRLKDGPERILALRYQERASALGRALGVIGPDLVELSESRARREEERRVEEAKALLRAAGEGAMIAFDERGAGLTSDGFAGRLRNWRDEGMPALALIIGGPDGLDASVRKKADLLLSFGALTLPHQLVRVLVVEQVYRALTILAGHPYHRAGDGDPRG